MGTWAASGIPQEERDMSEIKLAEEGPEIIKKKVPEMTWRQGTLGFGIFTLVVALFVSAGAKGSLGWLPTGVTLLGVTLILISAVAGIASWVSARFGSGKRPSA
jgi:hypothetical protein